MPDVWQLNAATLVPICSSTAVSGFTECIILMGVWDSEVVPADWCKGIILPLCKSKNDRIDRSQCGTFRGIGLLTVPGKFCAHFLLSNMRPSPLHYYNLRSFFCDDKKSLHLKKIHITFYTHVERDCPDKTRILAAAARCICGPGGYVNRPALWPETIWSLLEFHPRLFNFSKLCTPTQRSDYNRIGKTHHVMRDLDIRIWRSSAICYQDTSVRYICAPHLKPASKWRMFKYDGAPANSL